MQSNIVLILLLAITSYNPAIADSIRWSIYDDLQSLNASCPHVDSCLGGRTSESLSDVTCHCSSVCTQLGTCCYDSPYLDFKLPEMSSACRRVSDDKAYFMVDRCPDDSVWKNLCEAEWSGNSDIQRIVPVTSLFSLITYKNYFCFRCRETTDHFRYWNVELGSSNYEFGSDVGDVRVEYVPQYGTWAATLGTGGSLIPVALNIYIPGEIHPLPIVCKPNVISHCAESWENDDVRVKCEAYMGIAYIAKANNTVLEYRNAHCAVCNYEDLGDMSCKSSVSGFGAKMPFSFTHLLDVNTADGEKVGKVEKCEGDFKWDPYAKKCRELACAIPGYEVKDGKCTPP